LRDLLKAKQHFKKEVQFIGPFETRLEAQIEEMCR
jgi:hypothetical protein